MTATSVRYRTYEEYLRADELGQEGNYCLLGNGEVVELPPEDEENVCIATGLLIELCQVVKPRRLVRAGKTEIQVRPFGDNRVNRIPDVMVLKPQHIELMKTTQKSTVLFGMPAPALVAEVVSPGSEQSDNYRRDYEWKRRQYQELEIPEYWIIDRHRQKVTVLILKNGVYTEQLYREQEVVHSEAFPAIKLSAAAQILLDNDI